MTMKEILLNDQHFTTIIDNNYFYVDKTRDIHRLVTRPEKNFFLSRPRRFGKSLLLYTLEELFSGNRQRFNGLWIDRSDYSFPRLPVVFLSLSLESDSPEDLKDGLMTDLSEIAEDYNIQLKVKGKTPAMYFGNLIKALSKDSNSEVAVLIDEYDAPVTSQMADQGVAEANAKILRQFFATLKKPKVLPSIGFTLVTGITRYALTSMDSGPNHLYDISLNPDFAGLCGFTLEEFDSLFADRLKPTLANLKNSGEMDPSDNLEDLRAKIFHWYDGYNWGGETRVLNPYSILHFFKNNSFDDYWIQSGRPGHLTALIKKRPLDFLRPDLDSIISRELRKSELNKLAAAPVLFHSGYLTVDTVKIVKVKVAGKTETDKTYSFRLPNHEVESAYYADYFSAILDLESPKEFKTKGERLKQAFLTKDAEAVSSMFSGFFAAISYYQRLEGEKAFHGLIHGILMGMDFKVWSELPGAKGRLDLGVELPEGIFVVIELRYRRNSKNLSQLEENTTLASLALKRLKTEEVDEILADIAMKTFDINKKYQILSQFDDKKSTEAEKNKTLAVAALNSIPESDLNQTLAKAVRDKLPPKEINKALREATTKLGLNEAQIDEVLSKAVQEALRDIAQKDYHGPLRNEAKSFIDLGLAIFEDGSRVKAAFRPEKPNPSQQSA
jgi:hypothetical protein